MGEVEIQVDMAKVVKEDRVDQEAVRTFGRSSAANTETADTKCVRSLNPILEAGLDELEEKDTPIWMNCFTGTTDLMEPFRFASSRIMEPGYSIVDTISLFLIQ